MSSMEELAAHIQSLAGQMHELKEDTEGKRHQLIQVIAQKTDELQSKITTADGENKKLVEELKNTFASFESAMANVQQRIAMVESRSTAGGQGGGSEGGLKHLIPAKNMMPNKFSGKLEDWRKWRGDVEDYLEEMVPGTKRTLQECARTEQEPTKACVDITGLQSGEYEGQIWRMLKIVTEGDARKVVLSSGEEQGFKAWKALHGHFEPGIAVREGQVVAEFSSLIMKPAKSVQETKNLILEMEERRRRVERVTGKAPDEMHAKSVLAGILDPETRKQVALLQGAKHTRR